MRRLVAIAALALAPGGAVAPAAIPAGPAWQLVYVTGYVYSEYSVQGATRIMLATSRGGEPRELARGTRPEWSPDGVRIAFAAPRGGIEVMRADGSGRRRLTEVGAQPAWSPDGRSLAFSTRGGPGIRAGRRRSDSVARRSRGHGAGLVARRPPPRLRDSRAGRCGHCCRRRGRNRQSGLR